MSKVMDRLRGPTQFEKKVKFPNGPAADTNVVRDSPIQELETTTSLNEKNPSIGIRWVKQAGIDFSVLNDIHSKASSSNGYGHVCFMAHHIVEKLLKGSVYAICEMTWNEVREQNFTSLIHALNTSYPDKTKELAGHVIPLEQYYEQTCYPTYWPEYFEAPTKQFSSQDADAAKEHAEAVLTIIRNTLPPIF